MFLKENKDNSSENKIYAIIKKNAFELLFLN